MLGSAGPLEDRRAEDLAAGGIHRSFLQFPIVKPTLMHLPDYIAPLESVQSAQVESFP